MSPVVEELVWLSRALGDPDHGLAILAEGNASALNGDSYWIKASGYQLSNLDDSGLVEVNLKKATLALSGADLTDEQTRAKLQEITIQPSGKMPSVETFMHAYFLTLPGVRFVGHTHPTSLLSLLCCAKVQEFAAQRLFPDEIVCCGPESVFVPYTDPGLPLARAIMAACKEYVSRLGETPKTIWLQNHGLIALGETAREVFGANLMAEKAAKVWLGSLSTGLTLNPLTVEQIDRIHTRPDEHYRQQLLRQLTGKQA